jgi:hypothetical protein
MGYMDWKLLLSASQAVTADADSTYYIDTEVTNPPWGRNISLFVLSELVTTAATGIIIQVCQKTSEPTHDDAAVVEARILAADLTAGKTIEIPLPRNMTILRYLRCYYDVIGGSESYTLSAWFGPST